MKNAKIEEGVDSDGIGCDPDVERVLDGVDWRSGTDCGGVDSSGGESGDAGGDVAGESVTAADLQTIQNAGTQAGLICS